MDNRRNGIEHDWMLSRGTTCRWPLMMSEPHGESVGYDSLQEIKQCDLNDDAGSFTQTPADIVFE